MISFRKVLLALLSIWIPRLAATAGSLTLAGTKGFVHFSRNLVSKIFVVPRKSFCAWRQTNCLSLVKVTSHSKIPAPINAAALFDCTVCSGNSNGAPR